MTVPANLQAVSIVNKKIRALMPVEEMSPAEALVHAAWLVALAEVVLTVSGQKQEANFEEILEAVRNS